MIGVTVAVEEAAVAEEEALGGSQSPLQTLFAQLSLSAILSKHSAGSAACPPVSSKSAMGLDNSTRLYGTGG